MLCAPARARAALPVPGAPARARSVRHRDTCQVGALPQPPRPLDRTLLGCKASAALTVYLSYHDPGGDPTRWALTHHATLHHRENKSPSTGNQYPDNPGAMAALPGLRAPGRWRGARTAHGLAGQPAGLGAVDQLLLAEADLPLCLCLLVRALCQSERVTSRPDSTNKPRRRAARCPLAPLTRSHRRRP